MLHVEFRKSKALFDELTLGGASRNEKLFNPFELNPAVAFRPVIVTVTLVIGPVIVDEGTVTVEVSVTFVELPSVGPNGPMPAPEKVQVSVSVPVVHEAAEADPAPSIATATGANTKQTRRDRHSRQKRFEQEDIRHSSRSKEGA